MIPGFDDLGDQFEVVQGYYAANETASSMRLAFSIYDTGASVVALSAFDQMFYGEAGSPVPIKTVNGAWAQGVGGSVWGDVSGPGTVVSDGMHSVVISNNLDFTFNLPNPQAASVPGIQMFVGKSPGSEQLPTITGTPIHAKTAAQPKGFAAWIDKQGYELNLGELFPELPEFAYMNELGQSATLPMPDVKFIESGQRLQDLIPANDPTIIHGPIRVALQPFGEDNQANPGDQLTSAPNPMQTQTRLTLQGKSTGGKKFLFDTGAMLSLMSRQTAIELGIDLTVTPPTSMEIAGASGSGVTVPGYFLDSLEIPHDTGMLRFKNAPVYVLDIGDGLDGILGMNLFNTAKDMLYDPNDPAGMSVQLTFASREPPTPETNSPAEIKALYETLYVLLDLMADDPAFAGMNILESNTYALLQARANSVLPWRPQLVPEPSTVCMIVGLAMAGALVVVRRRRRVG